jgi:hypothetical protein
LRRSISPEYRVKCDHCSNSVKPTLEGKCPNCNAPINLPTTMETLPQTVSVFCRDCRKWVSATKVKPLTNWFHRGKEYAAGLYQIEEHKRSGLLKLKCGASGRVYKQTIRLSHKRHLS